MFFKGCQVPVFYFGCKYLPTLVLKGLFTILDILITSKIAFYVECPDYLTVCFDVEYINWCWCMPGAWKNAVKPASTCRQDL